MTPLPEISIVVPVFNEAESLPQLHGEIVQALDAMGRPWEVIYTDDRSTDDSHGVLLGLAAQDPHVRVLRFRRNFGQTAAMAAGFEHSRGGVVVTMDADLQNDPADVPRLVERLEAGADLVVGWRKNRQDGLLLRKVPSRVANRLIARVTGAHIHDTGCTLKAFRRELVENLPIYAEQHRFLPVLALGSGARLDEVVVNHRARIYGISKYGMSRAVRVLLDLFAVKLISGFSRSPLVYFALLGLPFLLVGVALIVVLLLVDLPINSLRSRAAVAYFSLLVMTVVNFLMLGLLAELAIKVSNLHRRKSYSPLATRPAQ